MKYMCHVFWALLAASASFAGKAYNISVVPEEGEELLLKDGDVISGTIDGTKRKVRILVANNAKIMLSNAEVLGVNEGQFRSAGIRCLGNCTLDLRGKNIMKGYYESYPGVQVPEDKDGQKYTMTIEGDGSLEASSNGYGTGIGCNRYTNCGHLVIKGGKIKAVGGYTSAGIGSCKDVTIGNIVIEGGEITAAGGQYAAGIGGGGYNAESKCGDITISGGKIIAMGGEGAAGIGSGYYGECGAITITNDVTKVFAIKGGGATYSIGKGKGEQSSVGTITIGGTVMETSVAKELFVFPAPPATPVDFETVGDKTYAVIDGDYSGEGALNIATDKNVDKVIFERTFPVVDGDNNYSTIMFPFAISADKVGNVKQAFKFLGIGVDKENRKVVTVEPVTKFEAYKPYLIQLESEKTSISIDNTEPLVLKAAPTADGAYDVEQSDGYNQYGDYVFHGVVQTKTWSTGDPDLAEGGAAYGFAGTAGTDVSVGQFVKVGEGAFIKPLRGYIYKKQPKKVKANGAYVLRQTASVDDDLPDVMNVVVVDRKKDGGEQTTVIGQFNSRTGEFRLNRTKRTYDLKGRSVRDASRKAKGVYFKK